MSPSVQLSDQAFARLQSHAVPLVDRPEDVIARLLDFYEEQGKQDESTGSAPPYGSRDIASRREDVRLVSARSPRERGGRVQIGDHVISAASVRDLYEQALRLLVSERFDKLNSLMPFRTSGARHLVAKKPVHPNGSDFVRSIQYRGFHMETHKDYKNAVSHLRKLVEKCGLSFRYLGG